MLLEGIQQVEIINQGTDWINVFITFLSVFLGALLAYLFSLRLNKKQFKENMKVEKENQQRIANLNYWNEVYRELLKSSAGLKEYRIKCIDKINSLIAVNIKYEVVNNNIQMDSLLFMDTQKELEYLMFRIKDSKEFQEIYNLYLEHQQVILNKSETLYSSLVKLNTSMHQVDEDGRIAAKNKFDEAISCIEKSHISTEKLLKMVIINIKKYS